MIGLFVILFLSSVLLHFFEKKNILALGFLPVQKRGKQFLFGFAVSALLCFCLQFVESLLTSSSLVINQKLQTSLASMFWWDFTSVLTEELVFRGALLILLMSRIGTEWGVMISAIAFGVYHWFSFGIFGNIFPMFFVFVGTGVMGYAWALAFSKTNSIFMPFGLHLGWNFTFNTIFSKGPSGEGLLTATGGHSISHWFSLLGLWVVPIIFFLIVKYFVADSRIVAGVKS